MVTATSPRDKACKQLDQAAANITAFSANKGYDDTVENSIVQLLHALSSYLYWGNSPINPSRVIECLDATRQALKSN